MIQSFGLNYSVIRKIVFVRILTEFNTINMNVIITNQPLFQSGLVTSKLTSDGPS